MFDKSVVRHNGSVLSVGYAVMSAVLLVAVLLVLEVAVVREVVAETVVVVKVVISSCTSANGSGTAVC